MDIINSSLHIETQSLSELPTHLLLPEDISEYVTQVHDLTQHLVNNPNCFILPSKIDEGRIFRTDIPANLKQENYYLPVLQNGIKTDPIWFTAEHPKDAYIFPDRSDDWIITCIKMKDHRMKDDKSIGYNFYINYDGDDDDDMLCSQITDYKPKRLHP
jgi:hypothetical protein